MRSSGVLLPVSSLPSNYGIGTFGVSAYDFIDKLKLSGQKHWQVLPLGPTSYGDSPYQSFSTFAGNPYFIDLDILVEDDLLLKEDCEKYNWGENNAQIDYEKIYLSRFKILHTAFDKFEICDDYKGFCKENSFWLKDYAFFMALKDYFKGISFLEWDNDIKHREDDAMKKYTELLQKEIDFYCFLQYEFYKQWYKLKIYANKNHIKIIGDIPIYVALDSADVWSNPYLYLLDYKLNPTQVAGCPPDDYAKTGQLWGNPIYDWKKHQSTGYEWWIQRIKSSTQIYDTVRIDHFRGFAEYYSIPATDKTAENGQWVDGPNIELFEFIKAKLGKISVIAEDLGYLTKSVTTLLKKSGFPGMKVLQFGMFAGSKSEYLPYNYTKNCVCYTGTHDNQTTVSWIASKKLKDRKFIKEFLNKKSKITAFDIICIGFASIANLVIVPMQDYLELSDDARMNIPSTVGGNWQWRLNSEQFSQELVKKIASITDIYDR